MTATRAPRRKLRRDPEPAGSEQPEPVPQPVPAATAPVPVITRTCSFCMSRRPLSELGQGFGAWECLDFQACMERAAASGMYPQPAEDWQAIAMREALQGAIR